MNESVRISLVTPERLELVHEIGRGGSSVVYLVQDRESGERYAMKILKQNMGEKIAIDEKDVLKEAEILAVLGREKSGIPAFRGLLDDTFPGISDLICKQLTENVQEWKGTPSGFFMEYIEGDSLQKILDSGRIFTVRETAEAGLSFCTILKKLHGMDPPLIYRDFKPANILVRKDGSYVLIDYGACRVYKKEAMQDTKRLGTAGYAAPEQYGGWEQSDVRTDIFGIGAVMHHMLLGKHPLETGLGPVAELIQNVEHTQNSEHAQQSEQSSGRGRTFEYGLYREMDKVLRRCCSVAPDMRFSSCAELEKALRKVLAACDKVEQAQRRAREKSEAAQERMWHKFLALAASALVFLFGSGMFSVSAAGAGMARYRMFLQKGASSEDNDVKTECYQQAVALRPEDPEGYIGFLTDLSSDGVITQREREAFEDLLYAEDHLAGMREKAPQQYALLELEIGKQYWAFYEGGTEAARQAVENAVAAGVTFGERKMAQAMQEILGKTSADGRILGKAFAEEQIDGKASAEERTLGKTPTEEQILGKTQAEARLRAWHRLQQLAREEAQATGTWNFPLAVSRMALGEIALRENTLAVDGQKTEIVNEVLEEADLLYRAFEQGKLRAPEGLLQDLREAVAAAKTAGIESATNREGTETP